MKTQHEILAAALEAYRWSWEHELAADAADRLADREDRRARSVRDARVSKALSLRLNTENMVLYQQECQQYYCELFGKIDAHDSPVISPDAMDAIERDVRR